MIIIIIINNNNNNNNINNNNKRKRVRIRKQGMTKKRGRNTSIQEETRGEARVREGEWR